MCIRDRLVVNVTEGQKKLMPIAIADFGGPKGADTVSYTHLDVYKRQVYWDCNIDK